VSAIPADRRDGATDHTLRFHGDAVNLLRDLQRQAEAPVKPASGPKRRAPAGKGASSGGGGGGHKKSSNGGGGP
jgi:hypothetical protein